jgi:hypothetical protein
MAGPLPAIEGREAAGYSRFYALDNWLAAVLVLNRTRVHNRDLPQP